MCSVEQQFLKKVLFIREQTHELGEGEGETGFPLSRDLS